jgi:hypothetical protein
MSRLVLSGLIAGLLAAATPSPAAPPAGQAPSAPSFRVEGGRLWGSATAAPLERVLAAIASQSGVAIRVHAATDRTVTARLGGVPVEDGLRRVLEGTDFLLVYGRSGPGAGARPRLAEVHVFPAGAAGGSPDPAGTGPIEPAGPSAVGDALAVLTATDAASVARRRAARALGREGADEAAGVLSAALAADDDPAVREALARALGRSGDAEAVPALARAVADDPDDGVREAAAHALGQAGRETAVEPLARALGDPVAGVRAAAAEALARTGGEAAAVALGQAALQDASAQVRDRALQALGRLARDEARSLVGLAASDPSARVRRTAGALLQDTAGNP